MRVLVVSSLFEPLLSTVYTSRFVQTVIVCLLAVGPVWATVDTCAPCVFPCKRSEQETFTIRLRGGLPDPAYAYSSVVRDTLHLGNEIFQALRFHRRVADSCSDTVIIASHVSDVVLGRTLGKVPPLYAPIHPVPEYQVTRIPDRPTSFLEIGPWVGYAGADSSVVPRIGFNNAFGGIEALIAPFGSLLGEKLQLGIGGGALFEGGRRKRTTPFTYAIMIGVAASGVRMVSERQRCIEKSLRCLEWSTYRVLVLIVLVSILRSYRRASSIA